MAVRLFVGNLPYDVKEEELREHFAEVGPLSYLYLPRDRETGQLRGFAFIEFNDRAQADEAIKRFNSQLFKGRPLAINEARAKEDQPRSAAPFRPSAPPPYAASSEPPTRGGEVSRDFGPDKKPRRGRAGAKGRPKSERAPKGPMRELVSTQFFGSDDDEGYDDDFSGENFASRVADSEENDNTESS